MHESLLFFLGLITGFVGTNTGGSALVTVPLLISLGVPPHAAVATSKVATVGSMVAGLSQFHKHGKVDYQLAIPACVFAIAGSLIGAYLLLIVPFPLLRKSVGISTLLLTGFSLLKKQQVNAKIHSRGLKVFGYFLFFITGLLGGFFGGQAILATYVFLIIFNKTLIESIGTRKVTGLAIALPSVMFYAAHDMIYWPWALVLVSGTLIGSFFGSQYAIKKGDLWVKKIFMAISTLLSVKLLFF